MTYKGLVRKGAVVLDPGVDLPDGTEVHVGVSPMVDEEGFKRLLLESSLDEAMDKLHLLFKIERGIRQADSGLTVSHDEARERLDKWLG